MVLDHRHPHALHQLGVHPLPVADGLLAQRLPGQLCDGDHVQLVFVLGSEVFQRFTVAALELIGAGCFGFGEV